MKNIDIGFVLRSTIKTLVLCVIFVCGFYIGATSTAWYLQSTQINTQTNGFLGFERNYPYTVYIKGNVVISEFTADAPTLRIRTEIQVIESIVFDKHSGENYPYTSMGEGNVTVSEMVANTSEMIKHRQPFNEGEEVVFTCETILENINDRSFWRDCVREVDEE